MYKIKKLQAYFWEFNVEFSHVRFRIFLPDDFHSFKSTSEYLPAFLWKQLIVFAFIDFSLQCAISRVIRVLIIS